jgi:segregation and condensation protein B
MRLTQIIEALLFASDAPLSAADLSRVDERLDEDTVEAVIQELRAEYEQGERSFQVYEVAGGYQLLTRPEFVSVLERYDSVPQPSRLSAPALEVLAIIAYRQPIGRVEVEDIRGVGSSGVLRTLTERNLVEPVGRGEGLGRPLLYGTTKKFLEHFGFRSLEDLPRPDELPVVLRERPAPQSEATAVTNDAASPADPSPAAEPGTPPAEPGAAAAEPGAPAAESTAVEPSAEASSDEVSSEVAPPAHQPSAEEPPAEESPAEESPAEESPADEPPAAEPVPAAGHGDAADDAADDAAGDQSEDVAPGAAPAADEAGDGDEAAEVREGVRG